MLACLYMSVSILNCYYCEFPVSTAPSSSQQQLLNKFEFIAVSENHSLTIWNSWYIIKSIPLHKLINTCYCLHAWTDSTIVFKQNKVIRCANNRWKSLNRLLTFNNETDVVKQQENRKYSVSFRLCENSCPFICMVWLPETFKLLTFLWEIHVLLVVQKLYFTEKESKYFQLVWMLPWWL